jgi:hypothetical protein
MRRYLYVRAEVHRSDGSVPSFAHCTIHAESEEQAYHMGKEYFEANPSEFAGMEETIMLNDYVVCLDDLDK